MRSKLTAKQAITLLRRSIERKDKHAILDLISPNDSDIMPNWNNESDYIFEKWEDLVDTGMETLGF